MQEISRKFLSDRQLALVDDYELVFQNVRIIEKYAKKYGAFESSAQYESSQLWFSLRVFHRAKMGKVYGFVNSQINVEQIISSALLLAESSDFNGWDRFPFTRKNSLPNESRNFEGEADSFWKCINQLRPSIQSRHVKGRLTQIETRLSRKVNFKETYSQSIGSIFVGVTEQENLWHCLGDFNTKHVETIKTDFDFFEREEQSVKTFSQNQQLQSLVLGPAPMAFIIEKLSEQLINVEVHQDRQAEKQGIFSIGQTVASSHFSLIDDANFELCGYSSPFDLEGIRPQKTTLIQQGVLRRKLCDTYEGLQQNRPSTANCHRELNSLSSKVMTSVGYIQPQPITREQLIAPIKKGYLGWRVDSYRCFGEHSNLQIHMKVKVVPIVNGELVRENTNIEIKINLTELLMKLTQCSNDLKFYGRYGAVSCLFEDLELIGESSCNFN